MVECPISPAMTSPPGSWSLRFWSRFGSKGDDFNGVTFKATAAVLGFFGGGTLVTG